MHLPGPRHTPPPARDVAPRAPISPPLGLPYHPTEIRRTKGRKQASVAPFPAQRPCERLPVEIGPHQACSRSSGLAQSKLALILAPSRPARWCVSPGRHQTSPRSVPPTPYRSRSPPAAAGRDGRPARRSPARCRPQNPPEWRRPATGRCSRCLGRRTHPGEPRFGSIRPRPAARHTPPRSRDVGPCAAISPPVGHPGPPHRSPTYRRPENGTIPRVSGHEAL